MRRAVFICQECKKDFVVHGDSEMLRKCVSVDPQCPGCEAPLRLGTRNDGNAVVELDAMHFWGAIHGFGMPDEVVAGPEAIEAMLLAHSVISVDVRKTKTGRVELRSITLANGVKLHLTASGEGAVVFKSTKEEENGSES